MTCLDVANEIFVGFLQTAVSILVVVLKVMSRYEAWSRVLAQLHGGFCRRNAVLIQLDPNRRSFACVLNAIGRGILVHRLNGSSQREV